MEELRQEQEKARKQVDKGIWNQFAGRLQEAWGSLNDDDLDRLKGRRDQLIGRIQEKTGEAREAIARKIDRIAAEIGYRLTEASSDTERKENPEEE
jgi:uncharacterized protein YjbJ (UPF0337 family)